MNIEQLNESLDKILKPTFDELVEAMKNLKGKYFCGTHIKNDETYAEVYDDEFEPAKPESSMLYADYTQDNIDIAFSEDEEDLWLQWAEWAVHRNEFEGNGYKFFDSSIAVGLDDYSVYKNRGEKPDLRTDLFITLYINPSKFDGAFDKIKKDIDNYVLAYKKKYDEIKKSNVKNVV